MVNTILIGDALEQLRTLPDCSVHCCVTSPPYWGLRDYGVDGQMGLEPTPEEYVARMVAVFAEVRRTLRDDGTLWLNVGDSFAAGKTGRADHGTDDPTVRLHGNTNGAIGHSVVRQRPLADGLKPKDLVGIPWRLAFALQADGWYLRSDIVWAKPNPMPESVRDRATKSHEYVFMLSKSPRYYWDQESVREPCTSERPAGNTQSLVRGRIGKEGKAGWSLEPERSIPASGRNIRDVWTIATEPCREAHFAVMPSKLVEPCIKAGCPVGGTVLDPFFGAGTVGLVAERLGRNWLGIELNPEYVEIAQARLRKARLGGLFAEREAA